MGDGNLGLNVGRFAMRALVLVAAALCVAACEPRSERGAEASAPARADTPRYEGNWFGPGGYFGIERVGDSYLLTNYNRERGRLTGIATLPLQVQGDQLATNTQFGNMLVVNGYLHFGGDVYTYQEVPASARPGASSSN